MYPTITTYTTTMPANVLPGVPLFPVGMSELEDSSSATIHFLWHVEYPHPVLDIYPESYRGDFIGILSDEDAGRMKTELDLFRKRFDDDLARRNKILFGK